MAISLLADVCVCIGKFSSKGDDDVALFSSGVSITILSPCKLVVGSPNHVSKTEDGTACSCCKLSLESTSTPPLKDIGVEFPSVLDALTYDASCLLGVSNMEVAIFTIEVTKAPCDDGGCAVLEICEECRDGFADVPLATTVRGPSCLKDDAFLVRDLSISLERTSDIFLLPSPPVIPLPVFVNAIVDHCVNMSCIAFCAVAGLDNVNAVNASVVACDWLGASCTLDSAIVAKASVITLCDVICVSVRLDNAIAKTVSEVVPVIMASVFFLLPYNKTEVLVSVNEVKECLSLGDTSDKLGISCSLGVMTGISSRSSCIFENLLDLVLLSIDESFIVRGFFVVIRAVDDGVGETRDDDLS